MLGERLQEEGQWLFLLLVSLLSLPLILPVSPSFLILILLFLLFPFLPPFPPFFSASLSPALPRAIRPQVLTAGGPDAFLTTS